MRTTKKLSRKLTGAHTISTIKARARPNVRDPNEATAKRRDTPDKAAKAAMGEKSTPPALRKGIRLQRLK
ncbi:hypothetical protein MASR2M48_16550 [Spirochaetota bacterium]